MSIQHEDICISSDSTFKS